MEETFHMRLYAPFMPQRMYLRSCLGKSGLGTGQPKLLAYLALHGPCSQRDLAAYFQIDPAAVSRMLSALEQSGHICRAQNQGVQAQRQDLLTDLGRREARRWLDNYDRMEQILLRGFSAQEKDQFAAYLSRAYRNFSMEQEEEAECGI